MKFVPLAIGVALAFMTGQASAATHIGQQVYAKNCASCHRMEDPKLGDKAAWKPLIARGSDALVASVLEGKGRMPHHGGKPRLPRSDLEAAVKYMMEKSK